MKLVGAGLGEDVDRRAGVSALGRIEVIGPDFHGFHNIGIG